MKEIYCGVDIGGTKINVGLVTKDGEVLIDEKFETKSELGQDYSINNIKNSIDKLLKEKDFKIEELKGIGIGSPGPLDSKEGIIIEACNLKPWKNVRIVDELREKYKNIPIKLQNDANVATLGEYLYGCGKECDNFVYITVSTGVGGGAVVDHKLQVGSNSNAFEVGHTIINLNGRKCNCGNNGCLEAYASGTAIARIANERAKEEETKMSKDGHLIAKDVFDYAKKKDKLALDIVKNQGFYLGIGLFNIIALYNPDIIAIGGGVSNSLDMFYDEVKTTLDKMSLDASKKVCKIVKAKRKDCGLIGAAALSFYLD